MHRRHGSLMKFLSIKLLENDILATAKFMFLATASKSWTNFRALINRKMKFRAQLLRGAHLSPASADTAGFDQIFIIVLRYDCIIMFEKQKYKERSISF